MKRLKFIPCVLVGAFASGCISQIRDEFDDTRVAYFNHKLASAAYCEACPLYDAVGCSNSFKLGFKAGFVAVANGSNGCPPVFPPSTKIFSYAWLDDGTPEERRDAWYDGYSHGVLAGFETGANDVNRIPARLPQVQQVDMAMPSSAPSEFAPLLPSPSPARIDGGLPNSGQTTIEDIR